MRTFGCTFILRMELNTDEKWMIRQLYNFDQTGFRISSSGLKSCLLERVEIFRIKLITMAVSLGYFSRPI